MAAAEHRGRWPAGRRAGTALARLGPARTTDARRAGFLCEAYAAGPRRGHHRQRRLAGLPPCRSTALTGSTSDHDRRARDGPSIGPVTAEPYPWPYDGSAVTARTALLCIDWQTDFCGPGGYVDAWATTSALTRAGLPATARLLDARAVARACWSCTPGRATTRTCRDLPANKRWRSAQIGAEIGAAGPCGRILVKGEPGWEIVPEVAPVPGEVIVDKPGKGAFYATNLDLVLRTRGITHLILTGITTDVCVHTTMREANDRGYECLILSDCTGATDPANHAAALHMVTMQGGVFGCVATSDDVIAATGQREVAPMCDHRTPRDPARTPSTRRPPRCSSSTCSATSWSPAASARASATTSRQLRRTIAPLAALLAACRARRPDRSSTPARGTCPTCPTARRPSCTAARPSQRIGDPGPKGRILIRGEYGHDIIDELAPLPGEPVIDKPGKGAFYATDLDALLAERGIRSLVVTGVTTEVCVHTTVREANDRGYECLVLADCVGSYFPEFQRVGLDMIAAQGGIFGWVADSARYAPRCPPPPSRSPPPDREQP